MDRINIRTIAAIVVPMLYLTQHAIATNYTVGGSEGWNIGVDYEAWVSKITFKQGDTLYFSYPAGKHSVLQVNQEDYNNCNTQNPMRSDNGQGRLEVRLSYLGTYNFICGVVGHCAGGQKVTIRVLEGQDQGSISTNSTSSSSSSNNSSSRIAMSASVAVAQTSAIAIAIAMHFYR